MSWKEKVKARRQKAKAKPSSNGVHGRAAAAPAPPAEPVTIDVVHELPFPADPAAAAFHGVAGDFVNLLEPHTEASRVAILLQTLTAFGSVIGRTPHWRVESTKHYLNLYAVAVGQTAKARKGTSLGRVFGLFEPVDPEWFNQRIVSGLSSGEGLIEQVRDQVTEWQETKDKTGVTAKVEVVVDQGVTDKRLLVVETEFASVLKQAERMGNVLSMCVRQGWESGNLGIATKNSPVRATGAHISIIGHITGDELKRYLTSTECASGFGNRFLWYAVRRSKLLPFGGLAVDFGPFVKLFQDRAYFARSVAEMPLDDEATEIWEDVYERLSRDRPGLVGAVCGRAEAQTRRLACLYALLDLSFMVEKSHLESAIALWDYCERSTAFIFGESTGDDLADEIRAALVKAKEGMSRDDIYQLFSRHQKRDRITRALIVLDTSGLAHKEVIKTAGRPKEIWKSGRALKASKA